MSIRLRILGYSGGYPSTDSPTSGYLISFSNKNILVDCGSGVLSELQKYIFCNQIDAIILTHLHSDHISDFPVLKYALKMNKRHGEDIQLIPVYTPQTPTEAVALLEDKSLFEMQTINEDRVIELDGAQISFFKTDHSVECYGIRFQYGSSVLAYTSDTVYDRKLCQWINHSDMVIMDCGAIERDRSSVISHMTPKDCFHIYEQSDIKRVVLSHLIPYYNISETLQEAEHLGTWPFEIAEMNKLYVI
jgi:ribonuclease BN (tRNA processing enzyme)